MNGQLPGLDQLRELSFPVAVSYWPRTWGWAIVAAVVLAGCVWAVVVCLRRYRRNRYRHQGLAELEKLERDADSEPLAARGLPALLKRVALAAHPLNERAEVAGLGGEAWLAYLARSARRPMPEDAAEIMTLLAYASDDTVRRIDRNALARLLLASRYWMEHHDVAA